MLSLLRTVIRLRQPIYIDAGHLTARADSWQVYIQGVGGWAKKTTCQWIGPVAIILVDDNSTEQSACQDRLDKRYPNNDGCKKELREAVLFISQFSMSCLTNVFSPVTCLAYARLGDLSKGDDPKTALTHKEIVIEINGGLYNLNLSKLSLIVLK
jgi:hypothetical protein